jgi:NhaP-type Na+/H+ or K+/H+ antiporter
LLAAVLVSELAQRSILSTAILFLVAGIGLGTLTSHVVPAPPDPIISRFIELALFSVLFTDGMRVGFRDLVSAWRLPGRALLLGLPLTLIGTAFLARYVVGLSWTASLLLGAILSPTDPVLAAAMVGREDVPGRLRWLLNIESGLNDGLALPVVVVMLSLLDGGAIHPWSLLGEMGLGLLLGVIIPWGAILLGRSRFFSRAGTYEPLYGFAIGLLVLASAWLTGANLFLAAFAAGITVATVGPEVRDSFHRFGELVTELLKLFAILLFGALISPAFLVDIGPVGYLFALLALLAVRPLALGVALVGSDLARREWVAAAWFGPKGFASMIYGLLILNTAAAQGPHLFHLVALVILGSIILHSSTDVTVARWFRPAQPQPAEE